MTPPLQAPYQPQQLTSQALTASSTSAAAAAAAADPAANINYAHSRTLVNEHQVEVFLAECGLSQYLSIFIEEGFDRLESLFEITEADLTQMQVKRGHRRLLQRAVASARGIPTTVPLNVAPLNTKSTSPELAQSRVTYLPPTPSQQITGLETPTSSEGSQQCHSPRSSTNGNSKNNNLLIKNTKITALPRSTSLLPPPPIINSNMIQPTIFTTNTNTNNNRSKNNKNNIKSNSSINSNNNSKKKTVGNEYYASAGTMIHTAASGMSSTEEEAVTSDNVHRLWKRKYHRHAKPDSNAPVKPPSAYVMFSNDVRQALKDENRSFTDLAKIIGDRWKNILAEEKERYETNALAAREEYLKKVEEYQKTDAYKKYQLYITEFKAQNEAAARPVGRPRKRHQKDGDRWVSDSAMSDYSVHSRRASSICSQPEEVNQQKHYLHYLLNDDPGSISSNNNNNSTPPSNPSSTSSTTPAAPSSTTATVSSSTPVPSNSSDQQNDSVASSSTTMSSSSSLSK